MHPKVYVSESFLEKFDDKIKEIDSLSKILDMSGEIESKRRSLCRIRDLMLSSDVTSDINDKKLVKLFTRKNGIHEKMSEILFHGLIKESAYKFSRVFTRGIPEDEGMRTGYCCFIGCSKYEAETACKKNGVIVLGKESFDESFFLEHSFAVETTSETLEQKFKVNHPCTSMVLIDRYFLGEGFEKKIDNFISFLNEMNVIESEKAFEVDIICANPENNHVVETAYNRIMMSAKTNLSLHLSMPHKRSFGDQSDRYILTNYCVIAIGHPFDRISHVSSNFYPSCESRKAIHDAYKIWMEKLLFAQLLKNQAPLFFGQQKGRKYSDDKIHVIFSQLN